MNLLYYEALSEFNKQYYADLLTHEHVRSGKIHIPKLLLDDNVSEENDFKGWELEKKGVKYLISDTIQQTKIELKDILPIKAQDCMEAAAKGMVYKWVMRPISMKFKEEKVFSFKELVDKFCSLEHSNPRHQKLNWFIGLTSALDRMNSRVCTPPGFGKDSTVDILGNLIGGCATIENPTVPKLEERASILKWLAVNEVCDISKANWREIEQILLAMGAFKPVVTKRSKAHGTVGEEINISTFSISLMYNDINTYTKIDRFFDIVAKGAIKDRFPAFRLYGTFKEDFNSGRRIKIPDYVNTYFEDYKNLVYTFMWHKRHMHEQVHHYNQAKLVQMPERWLTNIGKLLNIIDVYCDTQSEFDAWIMTINNSLKDYKDMLDYPDLLERSKGKLSIKKFQELKKELKKMNTFTEKKQYIENNILSDKGMQDVKVNEFWN